jgi:hypothetical protein
VRPATAWLNDIQKQITVGGQKNFRGQNPDPGTAISYWLKRDAGAVRVSISDINGREVRALEAPKSAGLNRVRWDLRATPPQRGPATGRAEQPAATAPAMQPPAANPPATPPATGQQGAGREDRPGTPAAAAGRGGRGGQPAAGEPQTAPPPQGGGGGRGRGGFAGPPLAPGTYLVKLTVDGNVVGTKTVTVREDRLQY